MEAGIGKAMERDNEGRCAIAGMQIAKPCLPAEFFAYLDGAAGEPEQEQPAQEETFFVEAGSGVKWANQECYAVDDLRRVGRIS